MAHPPADWPQRTAENMARMDSALKEKNTTCEYPLLTTTVDGFLDLSIATLARPGDCVLFRNAFRGVGGWLISRTQRRMIRDLYSRDSDILDQLKDEISTAASYTHAACYGNRLLCIEMTRPRARSIEWIKRLQPGDSLLIRRPVLAGGNRIDSETGRAIAREAMVDARNVLDYPFSELYVFYLWSWGVKKLGIPGLRRRRSVLETFDKSKSDVCSARYWYWCMTAGVKWDNLTDQERIAATHYPAELAVSPRFETICEVRIVADPPAKTPKKEQTKMQDHVTSGTRAANGLAIMALVCVAAIIVGMAVFGCGCIQVSHTRYANNNVEHMDPDSRGVASQGNAAANAASFSDTATVTAPASSAGQDGEGDGDRQTALFANSHSHRASDVDTAAALQAMKDTENSTGSQTSPQAVDTSTADAVSTTSPTTTETTTVNPSTLSGNQVQTPMQGSSTGGAVMEGTQGDNAGQGTQDNSKTITCPTCGQTGVTATEPGKTWTCELCGQVNDWAEADCTKEGCTNCRDCQLNP